MPRASARRRIPSPRRGEGRARGPARPRTGAGPCVFCAIAAGRAPASLVWADATTLAFLDTSPVRPGHVLVIPRTHRARIWEATPAEVAALGRRLPALAAAVKAATSADAVMLMNLNGSAAGQTVFHLHVHVIPVRRAHPLLARAGREIVLRAVQARPRRRTLDALAARIRAALAGGRRA